MLDLIKKYEKIIDSCKNTKEIKKIVRKLYKDIEIDDIDFSDIIYDSVIPKLESWGCDLEKDNNTNYENVMLENY